MKNIRYFYFIALAIAFQSFSAIFGKYAAISLITHQFMGIITNPFYILSMLCLGLQAVVWQRALRYYPLSVAYPFMGLVNFVVLFSSAILFHEGVTLANLVGLVLISFGIIILSHDIDGAV